MKTKIRYFLALALALLLYQSNFAQQRFKGGIIAGFNLSELVDGGSLDSHVGVNIGGKIVSPISKHWQWGIEMLFSQQADYLPAYSLSDLEKFKINWLEIPVQLDALFEKTATGFYRGRLSVGAGYARLINVKAISSTYGDISDFFDDIPANVVIFHLGSTAFLNEHFAINGKGTLSTHWKWTLAIRSLWMF